MFPHPAISFLLADCDPYAKLTSQAAAGCTKMPASTISWFQIDLLHGRAWPSCFVCVALDGWVFPLLLTNQKIWLGLKPLPSIPRTRQRVNSGEFSTWMYLPYCVPIHWGEGELAMPALDSHSIHRLFWKSCKLHFLSCFLLFCFVFWHLADSCWVRPVPVGLRAGAVFRHGLPSI